MKKILLLILGISYAHLSMGQNTTKASQESILQTFNEKKVQKFKFSVNNKNIINTDLTNIISIDKVTKTALGFDVVAYANKSEFISFLAYQIPYEIIQEKSDNKAYTMATTVTQMASWNRYPTYSVYKQMMLNFAANYPSLCDLDTILAATPDGHQLLVLKISDNVNVAENEPKILFSSTIHGNEGTGFVLLLRLADYLLSNYNTNSQIAGLVNQIELWIAPLANPDGCYNNNDNTISPSASIRYNANSEDLNRDYPRLDGNTSNTDSTTWEPETKAFIKLAKKHHFNLSVNCHDGIELLNFPWDTWTTPQNICADDAWWRRVCRRYADTTQLNAGSLGTGYFTDEDNGITQGADWYIALGSRQDYMNYFEFCREVTLEMSTTQPAPTEQLQAFWNAHYRSFINYIEESLYGLRGTVSDACTGIPLKAKVWVASYDQANDSSQVYSRLPLGNYFKYLGQGTYSFTFSAPGYQSKTIPNITITNYIATTLNVQLTPNNAPDAQFSYSINSNTVDFTNNSTNATSYFWKFGDGNTSTLANPTHTYATIGNYNVTLGAYQQLCADSMVNSFIISSVYEGKEDFLSNFVIGNPVNDRIYIKSKSLHGESLIIRLFSVDGHCIFTGNIEKNDYYLDISGYSKGIYFLEIENRTTSGLVKLIKI